MRQSSDRQKSLLAELALVNERLAGKESWEIRQKLEHLKSKRKNWELIYEYVTKLDATATLARIEEANTKVQELLSEEAQERTSVADLQHQLVDLQAESSLEIEEGLKNFWYPAAFASQLHKDKPVSFDLFGQPWVLFRNKAGEPACVRDECAHRACPLSLGKVIDGNIQCAYHGWQYDQQGQCVSMPSTAACPNVGVSYMACKEEAGFVLVWPGQGPQPAVPNLAPPEGFQIHAEIEVEVEVEHGIQKFWQNIAGQVLGEDLVLVKGQQERMVRGADIWQHPVSYDKLAVRYRRWRNSLDSPEQAKHEASQAALSKMSAGELFRIEEDCDSEHCEV
ncbi:hypothetical protein WJX82_010164 [Trebouxia sp. C0006]